MDATKATDWDHRIIDAVSIALCGEIGRDDDCARLLAQVDPKTPGKSREDVLAEMAVAFIRWAQDLKERSGLAAAQDAKELAEYRERTARACQKRARIFMQEQIEVRDKRIASLESQLQTLTARLGEVEQQRDAWQRQWKASILRIGGPSNDAAASNCAEYILQTLCRWRDQRAPGPFIVDAQMDKESFVVLIRNAISARTEELETELGKLRASLTTLRTAAEEASTVLSNCDFALREGQPNSSVSLMIAQTARKAIEHLTTALEQSHAE